MLKKKYQGMSTEMKKIKEANAVLMTTLAAAAPVTEQINEQAADEAAAPRASTTAAPQKGAKALDQATKKLLATLLQ